MPPLLSSRAWRPYGLVVVAVLAAYGLRMLLAPILQTNHPYVLFYPVVLLAAYACGRGPAALAAGLSTALGFWTFAEPTFGLDAGAATITPLLFFVLTCCVGVYLITALTDALGKLARDQGRLQAVADAHAGLFTDLQARIGHHMSLIASVLSLQARGEPDPEVLVLLRKAGERSELIGRAHREAIGATAASIDFAEFARALARIACRESGQPFDRVEIDAPTVHVPIEVGTSLGVALAECLSWILNREPSGVLRIRVADEDGVLTVGVSHSGDVGAEVVALAPAAFMFRAMVEQLGARVALAEPRGGAPEIELSVPLALEPLMNPAGVTVH